MFPQNIRTPYLLLSSEFASFLGGKRGRKNICKKKKDNKTQKIINAFSFATMAATMGKAQLEASLHKEKKLIEDGRLKDENPLDMSETFSALCEACRRGDLKTCQEVVVDGVNINARDRFDYTPLILVSCAPPSLLTSCFLLLWYIDWCVCVCVCVSFFRFGKKKQFSNQSFL